MNRRALPSLLFVPTVLLAGCAGPAAGDYPSLARRAVEQQAQVVEPSAPPQPIPEPVSATLSEAIAALGRDADRGNAAFRSALGESARIITAGRGSPTGSENWAQAQVALSRVETARAPTLMALAELDRLSLDRAEAGDEAAATALAAQRDRVAAITVTQQAEIARLTASLN